MAVHNPQFNLYGTSLDGTSTKKFTESHPNLSATDSEFVDASIALQDGYGFEITEATLQSETTVFTAG